jgi:hypothetical protein
MILKNNEIDSATVYRDGDVVSLLFYLVVVYSTFRVQSIVAGRDHQSGSL